MDSLWWDTVTFIEDLNRPNPSSNWAMGTHRFASCSPPRLDESTKPNSLPTSSEFRTEHTKPSQIRADSTNVGIPSTDFYISCRFWRGSHPSYFRILGKTIWSGILHLLEDSEPSQLVQWNWTTLARLWHRLDLLVNDFLTINLLRLWNWYDTSA